MQAADAVLSVHPAGSAATSSLAQILVQPKKEMSLIELENKISIAVHQFVAPTAFTNGVSMDALAAAIEHLVNTGGNIAKQAAKEADPIAYFDHEFYGRHSPFEHAISMVSLPSIVADIDED